MPISRKKTDEQTEGVKREMNFEKALARLETIVSEMESGSLSLENMMARFEEGQTLVTYCADKLNEVERRIEILVKKDGEVKAEPFTVPDDEQDANGAESETGKLF